MDTVTVDGEMYQLCRDDKTVNRCLKCAFRHAGGEKTVNKSYRREWQGCGRIIRQIREEFGRGLTCLDYSTGKYTWMENVYPRGYYTPVDPLCVDFIKATEDRT